MDDFHAYTDDPHEPREQFVRRLEDTIRAEVRRPTVVDRPRRMSRPVFALAAAAVVLISMAIGGGAVALAYQAQRSDQRQRLVAVYELRVTVARVRAGLAGEQLKAVESRVSTGVAGEDEAQDARQVVTEAQAQLRVAELQVEEVRLTSQEPLDAVSAPLASGRDFVSERWRTELSVPQAAVERERQRLQAAERRVAVGLAKPNDVALAGLRVIEVEAAIETLERKLAIRQSFVKGLTGAALAELRVLETEAEQRRGVLTRRIDFGARQMKVFEASVQVGTLSPIDLAGERLRLQELQLEMTKAEYDLALIREQIKKHK